MPIHQATALKHSPDFNYSQPKPDPVQERRKQLQEFAKKIENIYKETEAQMGEEDLTYIRRIQNFSRAMEILGRSCIHFSFEPLLFSSGVTALWIHKQLETSEIGHSILHGAYDRLTEDKDLQSKSFNWKFPVDEESWRQGHNMRHHAFTNIADKDPDIHFGILRLTPETPHRLYHYVQLPVALFFIMPNFGSAMNTHFTGLLDFYLGNGRDSKTDFLPDRSLNAGWQAHKKAFRKFLPYYAKDYVFYPMLAGPFFWKVMLGNWLSDKMRDVYTATTVFCGHVGADVKSYDEGTQARGRGEWYAMQVESANNFKVSLPLSLLCGGLDMQIEHHLFPRLPPHRLRKIRDKVQASCEEYGVQYHSDTWGGTIKKVFKQIAVLSLKQKS